jgi:hypothetical protein
MRAACEKMSFPARACEHRRGNFPAEDAGFAFGGGRQTVGNIKRRSQRNAKAMDELLADKSIGRMATYPIRTWALALHPTGSYLFSSCLSGRLLQHLF